MNYAIDRGVEVSVADLAPNPWNINEMTPRQNAAVGESIQEFGQVIDLVVRPHPEIPGKYQVIDGEHRLGHSSEKVFVTVVHGIPDAQAKKLGVILNETKGRANKVLLTQLLAGIEQEIGTAAAISGLPYSDTEFTELVKMAQVDWDNFSTNGVDVVVDALPSTEVEKTAPDAVDVTLKDDEDNKGESNSLIQHPGLIQSLIDQVIEIINRETAPEVPPAAEEAIKAALDYYIANHRV